MVQVEKSLKWHFLVIEEYLIILGFESLCYPADRLVSIHLLKLLNFHLLNSILMTKQVELDI